jgi:Holliday junction resolvase RusA-like endonuclease
VETEVSFRLYGEFTDLNTYINAERRNKFLAAKLKKEETWRVSCFIRQHFGPGAQVMEAAYPLHVTFTWYTKNERKDPDGLSFGAKAILDGMVQAKLIRNDGRKEVASITHLFKTDKEKPRVEVTLKTENTLHISKESV